jgi:hypothetical protein
MLIYCTACTVWFFYGSRAGTSTPIKPGSDKKARFLDLPHARASKTGLHPIKTFCAFLSEDRPIYVLSSSCLTPSPRLRIHARLRTLQCTRFLGSRNGSETAGYTGSVALDTANMAPWDRRWQPWEVACRADGLGSSERGSREGWRSGTAPG